MDWDDIKFGLFFIFVGFPLFCLACAASFFAWGIVIYYSMKLMGLVV